MPDGRTMGTDEAGSIRILYVDDEPDFAALAGQFLTRESNRFTVVTEERAADGLDRLGEGDIDCVVSDYDMPEMDGLEFLRAVREDCPSLPFILVTGRGSEELASEAISAGVTDYLQKRGGREQYTILANRIKNAVAQSRAESEANHHRRVSELVRDVMRSVVGVTDTADITQAICDHVADSGPYRFAWVGVYDPATETLQPRATAGVGTGSLGDVNVTIDGVLTEMGPAGTAFRERRVVTAERVHHHLTAESWHTQVPDRGYQSVAALPLAHDETIHGVLCVYATSTDAFDETERTLLADLGETIGRALDARRGTKHRCAERPRGARRTSVDDSDQRQSRVGAMCAAAMAASSDGMAVVGSDGRFEYLNDAHAALYGYDVEDLVGESWRRLYGPEERVRFETEVLPQLRQAGQWRGEAVGRRADGTRFSQEVTLSELDGPEFLCVVRDVTHRREKERELERQNNRLDGFASVVSHDLRGPLSIATGNIALARELTEERAVVSRLDAADRALDRIDGIIEDVLALARGADEIEPTLVSLDQTVADCWQDEYEHVTVGSNAWIVADRGRLQRLLENLFRNAVEHGPDADGHESVELVVSPLPDEDGFFVEDDGKGIPTDVRETVFEPGYTTNDSGTGLGLDIVKRIADEHGWDCRVTTGRDGGARFEFVDVDVVEEPTSQTVDSEWGQSVE